MENNWKKNNFKIAFLGKKVTGPSAPPPSSPPPGDGGHAITFPKTQLIPKEVESLKSMKIYWWWHAGQTKLSLANRLACERCHQKSECRKGLSKINRGFPFGARGIYRLHDRVNGADFLIPSLSFAWFLHPGKAPGRSNIQKIPANSARLKS